tara:strand:+ start:535 stop:765 length:231 start_codon:yes stop_codon:yes gene_type:complete
MKGRSLFMAAYQHKPKSALPLFNQTGKRTVYFNGVLLIEYLFAFSQEVIGQTAVAGFGTNNELTCKGWKPCRFSLH